MWNLMGGRKHCEEERSKDGGEEGESQRRRLIFNNFELLGDARSFGKVFHASDKSKEQTVARTNERKNENITSLSIKTFYLLLFSNHLHCCTWI